MYPYRALRCCVAEDTADPAEEFCSQYMTTCASHNSFMGADMAEMMSNCMMSFSGTPMGSADDTSGYTQTCRTYHLGAAMNNAALHCPHASSEAVCVTPAAAAFCSSHHATACAEHDSFMAGQHCHAFS